MTPGVPWLDRLAHDLRGPLSPLQTAIYLLKSGQLEAGRQQELHELMERQTRRLGRMIDEVGDWSRASQGNLLGTLEPCDGALIMDYALSGMVPAARVTPTVVDESQGATVQGDQRRLVQLLRTLIEYAGHRARGTAPLLRLRTGEGSLWIEVTAPGALLAGENPGALLEQPMPEPDDEGLGLRLLIARAIAEAHGGSLGIRGEGEGDRDLVLRCALPLSTPA